MLRRFFLPILVVFGILGTAWADNSVGIPDVHIGDMWKYRNIDGYSNETNLESSHRIIKLDDKEIVVQIQYKKTSGNRLAYYTREWNLTDQGDVRWEPFNPDYKFPMSVGLTWNQEFKWSNNKGEAFSSFSRIKIVALEKVTVPAGTFDAYRIEREVETRSTGTDANVMKGRIITWYAPAAKKYVRRESTTLSNGRERNKNIDELTEYSLRENLPAPSK
jgi:hypothetical protein